jgi:hypothetical protein
VGNALIGYQLWHDSFELISPDSNQRYIVTVFDAEPLDRGYLKSRSGAPDNVLKHQPMTPNIGQTRAARQNGYALATSLQACRVQRPNNAPAVYQNVHRYF